MCVPSTASHVTSGTLKWGRGPISGRIVGQVWQLKETRLEVPTRRGYRASSHTLRPGRWSDATLQASVSSGGLHSSKNGPTPPESRRVERTWAMTSSKIELTELLFAHARFSLSMAAHIRRTARSQLEDLDRWMPVFAGISGLIPRSLAAAEAELARNLKSSYR
jgi:hypothetical protein